MRVPRHIVDARRERLRTLVRQDGFLPISEVCRRLDVSEATARRDLEAIAAEGHISRTYGGALADYNTSFASLGERARRARGGKALIARRALREVPRSGVVFLDAGTTVLGLARLLARRRDQALTVVTNSVAVASVLGGAPGVTLHLLGGVFLHRQATLFGEHAVTALASWSLDASFLGGEAMDAEAIWNSHPDVIRLQQTAATRARAAYFLLDATKIGRSTPHVVVGWREVGHLVTDASPGALADAGIALPRPRLLSAGS